MNYYRRYVGDYLRDTARLSMLEHGAYNLLLDYYYADEQPLPLDKDELYIMVRAMTPGDRKAVDKVIAKFFERQADGYHQKRADHEIEVSKKARSNGKGGGRPPTRSGTGTITGSETGEVTGIETEQPTEQQTEPQTGEGGGSVHPPTTNHLSTNHQPLSPQPTPGSTSVAPSDDSLGAAGPPNGKRKNGHPKPFLDGPKLIAIPLVGEKEYDVHQSLADELERAYPAVDVQQTLREIRVWNLANPRERKTESGILRHINRWFEKEQNRG